MLWLWLCNLKPSSVRLHEANDVPQHSTEKKHCRLYAKSRGEYYHYPPMRSRWQHCLVSRHFFGNVVVVDLSDLTPLLCPVNLQISNLIFTAFPFSFRSHC